MDRVNIDVSERELLKALGNNNRQAAEKIYLENFNLIQRLVINNNGNGDDARDIFQEAMIVLYEHARDPGFELTCQIKTYLFSVSRRLWLKRLQQMKHTGSELPSLVETVAVEQDLEEHEQRDMDFKVMEKAMVTLGEPCKSLLEAYYIEKKSMMEIAGDFGYTNADNAKNQKYKCLMRLKKVFFTVYKNEEI
jgi:RNA polymerase sigma factor (sigma-70 family)